ncbi:MAG: FimB/Mfa2 family fimbrial subunit [Bacteroidales bacterium]|nr:FimB/Mfa2 family fimbrial subunit [Bacteroidales bacterium]
MKRFLFVIGALLAAAAGCDREPCAACTEELPARHVILDLGGSAIRTKSPDVPSLAESNVVRSLLYVFSRNGSLVDSYSSSDGRFDFYLTDELYDFVVVANKADLPRSGITKAELFATPALLSENAPGSFIMAGVLSAHRIEADEKITVEVKRLVDKISCTIRTAFTGALAGKEFRVEEIYLTNVVGFHDLGLSDMQPASSALWYNRMEREDPPQAGCPVDLLQARLDVRMAASDSLVCEPAFYPYPNASPDSHDRTQWGSRCTRFVVRATLGGRTTWYPVTLEQLQPNYHYQIDLTVSNYGVEHPEDPLSAYAGVVASVSVAEWTDGGSLQGLY